jgi:hypothetical protein
MDDQLEWELTMLSDGSLLIEADEPGPAGAARLEFADGSFIDIDAATGRDLLKLHAHRTRIGDWLLRVAAGDAVADDYLRSNIDRATLVAPRPSAEFSHLAAAALAAFLSEHDDPALEALWCIDVLAELSQISAPLDDLPLGFDPTHLMTQLGSVRLREDLSDEHRSSVAGALERVQSWLTARADRRPSLDGIDGVAHEKDSVISVIQGLRARVGDSSATAAIFEEIIARNDWEVATPVWLAGGEKRAAGEPVFAVDRGRRPKVLGRDALVRMERDGTRYRIGIENLAEEPTEPLFLRLFVARAESGEQEIRQLVRLHFDRNRGSLSAVVDLIPEDFDQGGSTLIEVRPESELFEPLPTMWEYWAAVTRSNLARLRLLILDPTTSAAERTAARKDTSQSAAHLDDASRQEMEALLDELPALAFVTPIVADRRRRRR